jgi:hypothetical protein
VKKYSEGEKIMKRKKTAGQETGGSPAAKTEEARKPVKAAKPAAPKGYAVVDFPQEGEIVTSAHYAFRIGASAADRAEVSVDDRDWAACRFNSGYWWFDWSGYGSGPHTVVARIPGNKGFVKSKPRHFTVLI